MKVNVHDMEIEIVGYDDYLKDFEEQALPDFAKEAESLLLETLDESEASNIEVYLEEEKTKVRKNLKFVFFIGETDGEFAYEYGSFTQE